MQTSHLKFVVFIMLLSFFGCASLLKTPSSKELFSWRYPKGEIPSVKELILKEGYVAYGKERTSCVDYGTFVDCYTLNRYIKESLGPKKDTPVTILITFKETTPPSDFYRNLGITVASSASDDSPEIKTEIERMENILYEKLLEIAGHANVVRGKR